MVLAETTNSWLKPFSSEIALHVDFAAALVALVALAFSIWSFLNQRRMSLESMRIERDNDLIDWIDGAIDIIIEIEFLLRGWGPTIDVAQFSGKRDMCLAKVAATIDKGRLYFPIFSLDVIGSDHKSASHGAGQPILDDLVRIYDLVNKLDPKNASSVKKVRHELMLKKRDFIKSAQDEVEPERRLSFVKKGKVRVKKERTT